MRTIAIEEHIGTPKIEAAAKATGKILSRRTPAGLTEKLSDVGAGRFAAMDAAGIDMQVLSATGTGLDKLDRATGTALARESNDLLAEVVRARPDRFAAFALLAMQEPERPRPNWNGASPNSDSRGPSSMEPLTAVFSMTRAFSPCSLRLKDSTSRSTCTRPRRRPRCTRSISAACRRMSPAAWPRRPGAGMSRPGCTAFGWWRPGCSTVFRGCRSSSAIWVRTSPSRWTAPTTA